MATDYNIIDIVFITSALIIIAIASFRGLIKEVFSLINWATAFVASYLLSGIVAKIFAQSSTLHIVAIEIITRVVIFTIVFLIMIFSTSGLAKEITSSFPPALNNFLGVIFGALKTLLIFGFLYATYLTVNQIIIGNKTNNKKIPAVISSAKTGAIIQYSGEFLQPLVYGFIGSIYNNYSDNLSEKTKNAAPLLNLMKNNYNLDELQQNLQDSQNPDNSTQEYQDKMQKLQQVLENNNPTNNTSEEQQPEPSPKQNPRTNEKPSEEKGYQKQEILKKDYIIKVINN